MTTQSSSLAGTVYASVIELGIIAYQFNDLTVTPFFRQKSIANEYTDTARFPRLVKSAGPAAPANESTAIAATPLTTTSATVQVGRIGLARELTETAAEDSVIGRALYVQGFIMDAARLYGEYFDTTATALFATVTSTVGTTATTLTIPTMVAAVASQRANKAKGPLVISLHDQQLKQLQQAQAAATATPWQTFYSPEGSSSQYGGMFMNAPVWSSGLNPISTGDRLGCIWVDGQAAPEYCAFAFVQKRAPSSKTESNILMDSNRWASFARTGHGIVANDFATSIRSVNS